MIEQECGNARRDDRSIWEPHTLAGATGYEGLTEALVRLYLHEWAEDDGWRYPDREKRPIMKELKFVKMEWASIENAMIEVCETRMPDASDWSERIRVVDDGEASIKLNSRAIVRAAVARTLGVDGVDIIEINGIEDRCPQYITVKYWAEARPE